MYEVEAGTMEQQCYSTPLAHQNFSLIILEIRMVNVRRQVEVHPLAKTVTVKEIIPEIQV